MKTNSIGLDLNKSENLTNELNAVLANYQVFYMNVRGYHWNITGKEFFQLHTKFEEIYSDLQTKIDELAERILTLDGQPLHSFSSYLERADIHEHTHASDADSTMRGLADGFKILIHQQRQVLTLASEVDDEGTAALMSDYIREQEKLIWMIRAWLS